jgi:hypothetical protein
VIHAQRLGWLLTLTLPETQLPRRAGTADFTSVLATFTDDGTTLYTPEQDGFLTSQSTRTLSKVSAKCNRLV